MVADFFGNFAQIALWTLWIWCLIAVVVMLVRVVADVLRDHTIGGWAKAGWLILLFAVPLVGPIIYLIARGKSMAARAQDDAERMRQAQVDYARTLMAEAGAAGTGAATELKAAHELLAAGAISQDDFDRLKEKLLV